MENIIQDVINLDVFDENGKLVTQLNAVTKGALDYSNNGNHSYLTVHDALFNIQMLEKIGDKVEDEVMSDFDKAQSDGRVETVIRFKKGLARPKFKLIGRGIIYDMNTGAVSHDFTLVMPNVELVDGYSLKFENEAHSPTYSFLLQKYNDENDIFELRLKERK